MGPTQLSRSVGIIQHLRTEAGLSVWPVAAADKLVIKSVNLVESEIITSEVECRCRNGEPTEHSHTGVG